MMSPAGAHLRPVKTYNVTSRVIFLTETKLAGLVTVEGKMDWLKSSSAYGGQFKLRLQAHVA